MEIAISLKDSCHNCMYCFQNGVMYECIYNKKINTDSFITILIPDQYACSCTHFKEKDENS